MAVTTGTNDDPHVYYQTADGHIHELAWRSPTQVWYHLDVTADTAGRPMGSAILAATTASLEPRVYYLDADQHVNELVWFSNEWHWQDITDAIQTTEEITLPLADNSSPVAVMTNGSQGDPRVYYRGLGQHVHELA